MYKKLAILIIIFNLFFISCAEKQAGKEQKKHGLEEDRTVYNNNVVNSVKEVYITILPAEDLSGKYPYTFAELNKNITEEIAVKVLFQEGKDGGPKAGYYGYGLTDGNGIMKLRGQSARITEQKSYKIELNKKGGLWNGYKVVNLNKHPFDSIRIRNKLSFDLIKSVPKITSLRTQFVHLFIRDLSEGDYQQEYKDYGLFTHVENLDTDFLKNRGLDPKGSLYKVENFEFYRYPDKLKLKSDNDYQEEIFEDVLEIKGNDDHTKLIHMLNDVNNNYKHINDIISEHFDRDNYLAWLAISLLSGNVDTASRNFFLYSPKDSNIWYFLPWDFDKALGGYRHPAEWQKGVSNYWGVVLHRRFLENRENVRELSQKVDSLTKVFTGENTRVLLGAYQPVATYFLSREPDNQNRPVNLEAIRVEFERLPQTILKNRQIYYQSLEKPMPVHMGRPIDLGKYYIFKWDRSYDLQGDLIKYSIDISTTPGFCKLSQDIRKPGKDGIRRETSGKPLSTMGKTGQPVNWKRCRKSHDI